VYDSVYVSRVVPLCPDDAIRATEAWYRRLVLARGGKRLLGGRKLLLRPRFEPTDFDPLLLRRLRGTLWVGWWWPVPIELELAKYSRVATEIALHPTAAHWPVAIERYGVDAARAVEEVVAAITKGLQTRTVSRAEPYAKGIGRVGLVLKPSQTHSERDASLHRVASPLPPDSPVIASLHP
jgi:hypothetical protein